jgi:4-hydroxybenzoate polyprenyltransferase
MNKKDRIAVVASVIMLIMFMLFLSGGESGEAFMFFLLPVALYWGYRFIQNDISFLKVKDD